MFIKKSFVEEIANSMERQLVDGAINKQAEQQAKLVKAADYLNAAAEIFDESGLSVQAEVVTAVLESLAAKKKDKNKAKDKKKPSKKPSKKAPSSEKMVNNLKEKGWMFDESAAHDSNCVDDNCAECGDMSYAADGEQWWHLSHPESGGHSSIKGSASEAAKHLDLKNKFIYPGWELSGPFKTIKDLEKKYMPHLFESDDTLLAEDGELYSMLDDFKSKSENMDFEDELDFEDFEDRVKVQDPFKNYNKVDLTEDVKVQDPFKGYNKVDVDEDSVTVQDPFSGFDKFYFGKE